MKIEYDSRKSRRNRRDKSRGFGFDRAEGFDWESCITIADTRRDYGEPRYISYGFVEKRLHVVVWTPRKGNRRIISLRKANHREGKQYEEEIQ